MHDTAQPRFHHNACLTEDDEKQKCRKIVFNVHYRPSSTKTNEKRNEMGRGVSLTETERTVVLALHNEGRSARHIAESIGKGKDAVLSVISSGSTRVALKKRGQFAKFWFGSSD